MKFETKFNVNDHAWFMKNNKLTEVVISAIEIFYVGTNQDSIKYSGSEFAKHISTWIDHTNMYEDDLFKTKDDLLKSL